VDHGAGCRGVGQGWRNVLRRRPATGLRRISWVFIAQRHVREYNLWIRKETDDKKTDGEDIDMLETQSVKVIVFDLDGTLYEDTHHFDYYAGLLERLLPPERRKEFADTYAAALNGHHALRIGRVYDAKRDLLLVQANGEVLEAYHWNGDRLPDDAVAELYPEPIELDLTDMVNVGDQWWIPPVLARHMGIPSEKSYEMFEETRRWMMGPEFVMKPVAGLAEELARLAASKKLVLLTNSPQPDSEAILRKLGLSEVFDLKIFQAQKPMESQKHMRRIAERYDCSYANILSVGDNWVNDVHQPRLLGCQTLHIDWFGKASDEDADAVVGSLQEMVGILKTL